MARLLGTTAMCAVWLTGAAAGGEAGGRVGANAPGIQLAQAVERHVFDVPAQPLPNALAAFGRQSGLHVTVDARVAADARSRPVSGTYTAAQALDLLLAGTGITWRFAGAGTVVLERRDATSSDGLVLAPIVVAAEAETARGPVRGYVARRSATGSKTDAPISEIPQTVSVIGREQLDDQQVRKADEALRYVAGVRAQPFGPDSDTDWFYIRGFDATATGVFLDGLPLYQYAFGGFIVDPFLLERIEVLKGPASVLYGGSSTGGIVNYVGKRPTGERLRYAETGIDNWGNAFAGFDVGDVIDARGDWSFRLTGRAFGGGTEVDHADGFRGVVAPSLTWRPDDATTLTLHGSYQHLDLQHTSGFLPYVGTVVDAPFGKIKRGFFYSEPDIDSVERRQTIVGYEFEHRVNDTLAVRQNVRYANVEASEVGPYPYGYLDPATGFPVNRPMTPDNLLNRIGFEHDTSVHTFSADNQAETRFATGAFDHTLLLGIDYRYYNIDQMQASGGGTPLSATDPIYGAPQGPVTPYLDQDLRMDQLGFYAQDQIKFGGWIATLNGRYDRVWTDSVDTVGAADFEGEDGEFSARAGLAYEFGNGLTPYVSVARSFNPTIGSDAAGKPFVPETGEQYEIGFKYEPTFFDATVTAALFDLTRRNVPVTDPDAVFFEVQRGALRSRGIEIEAKANVTENVKLLAAFSAFDLEITEDTNPSLIGKQPALMPEVQASAWLDYTFDAGLLQGLSIGGGGRFVGSSFADQDNDLGVPSSTVFDAGLRYERGDWGVALNVTNIFDREYVAGCDTEYVCNYGDRRTAMLRISRKW